jgi:23S rRNA pseudouridine1911/1915/1917 synthase
MKKSQYRFEVHSEGEVRVDKYLADHMPEVSRSQIRRMIDLGHVTLDGIQVEKAGLKIKTGCILEILVILDDSDGLVPETIPLEILFEDERVIVTR